MFTPNFEDRCCCVCNTPFRSMSHGNRIFCSDSCEYAMRWARKHGDGSQALAMSRRDTVRLEQAVRRGREEMWREFNPWESIPIETCPQCLVRKWRRGIVCRCGYDAAAVANIEETTDLLRTILDRIGGAR